MGMKTRDDWAKEFIFECEQVLLKYETLDRAHAQDRAKCRGLLEKCKTNEDRATILALYLFTVAAKSEHINKELTIRGRAGDKEAIMQWMKIMACVQQLNKTGGSYGNPISWTVKEAS